MIIKWIAVILMALLTIGTGAGVVYEAGRQSVITPKGEVENKIGLNQDSPTKTEGDGRCIVTVEGNKYDVTQLANSHSGPRGLSNEGGFFKCGTDMTSEYTNKHGSNLGRMSPYLVTGSSTNIPVNNNPINRNPDDDEWEDEDD